MKIGRFPPASVRIVQMLALAVPMTASAATLTVVGVDEETNDGWRTDDLAKPFGDTDNVYGSEGYVIAQYADGDQTNVAQPSYAAVTINGTYEAVGAEPIKP